MSLRYLADGPGVSKIYLGLQESYFRMTWITHLFDQPPRHQGRALAAKAPRAVTPPTRPSPVCSRTPRDDIAVGAAQRRVGLRAKQRVPLGDRRERRSRAVDQQLVIFIAPLANDLPTVAN